MNAPISFTYSLAVLKYIMKNNVLLSRGELRTHNYVTKCEKTNLYILKYLYVSQIKNISILFD